MSDVHRILSLGGLMDRLLGWVIGTAIGAIIAGWRTIGLHVFWWLAPRTPSIDVAMERWATARTVIGFLIVIAASLIWDPEPSRLAQRFSDAQASMLLLPFQIATAVIVAAVVLVSLARPGERARMARNVLRPIKVVGIVLIVLVGAVAAMWGMSSLLQASMSLEPAWQTTAMILSLVLYLSLSFAGSAAAWYGFRSISKHCFRARDGHPAMSAIVMIVLSLWTLTVGVLEVTSTGWDTGLPPWLAACLLIVGPIVVLALSTIELIRLPRRFGIPLRQAI